MITFKLTFTRHLLVVALLALALAVQAQNREVKMITSTDLISLHAGWNLISLDLIPTPATPEAVFAPLISASNLQMVTGFQNQMGKFFDPTGLPFLNTLTQIVAGEGYWVKVTTETSLSVTGTTISPTFAINLKTGWNLICYWPAEAITPEAAFASLINTGKLQMITGYEQGGKFYDPNGLPFLNTLTEIKNGFGYWVKLNADFNGFRFPVQWNCGDWLIDDRDGNIYTTVQIGNQCWMSQNLNIGDRIDGTNEQSNDGIIEKYCYNNDEANCDVYGGLYQWDEMMQYYTTEGIQGICPTNWHLPTDVEWTMLTTFLGGESVAGGKMKETGTIHWGSPNTGATNSSGFTALPGGYSYYSGEFFDLRAYSIFWSSTSRYSPTLAWFRQMYLGSAEVYRANDSKGGGLSVRCLRYENTFVTPPNQNVTASAGTTTFDVYSSTTWTVAESVSWLSVSPASGSNNGTLTVTYDANAGSESRIGQISITSNGVATPVNVAVTQVNSSAWVCGQALTDTRDSKTYTTVQIGTQCWMAENLNIGNRIDNINIQTNNGTIEKYCYNNLEPNCDIYGGLYQWDEMMQYTTTAGVKGICPTNWHLPTDTEWTTLTTYVSSQAANRCDNNEDLIAKSLAATTNWATYNGTCAIGNNLAINNTTGFTGLPGGKSSFSGTFVFLGDEGYFWSSTDISTAGAYSRELKYFDSWVDRRGNIKGSSLSVRCVRDETPTSFLNVTPLNQNVTASAGTATFNVSSNTSWTVAESVSWLSVSPASGSNNGTLTVTYDANAGSEIRIGQITITADSGTPVVNIAVTQESSSAWACGQALIDSRDGKAYSTVEIGTQCWMAQNLNIGTRIDAVNNQTDNGTIEKYCFDNTETNCDVYGGLYQWNEMMQYSTAPGVKGICPTGWHLPTDAEWCTLEQEVDPTITCSSVTWRGVDCGGKLKETGTTHWNSPNTGATNSSGFTALPGGNRGFDGSFLTLGDFGAWWSSSPDEPSLSLHRELYYNGAGVYRHSSDESFGFSVRCLKGESTSSQLEVNPPNQNVSASAGETNFNITSNTTWSVTENNSWLSVSPLGGSNNGSLTVIYVENTSTDPRVGHITITAEGGIPSVTVSIIQEGFSPFSCGQSFTDSRDGQTYTTVQIGTQCWMKQNLNIGSRIDGTNEQTNNGTIEKYCYNNVETNCDVYGGLYQWDEMMQYTTTEGVKGICPTNWHLPTDAEWTTLTNYVSSQPAYRCNNNTIYIGKALAATTNWYTSNDACDIGYNLATNNATGFTALPAGDRGSDGNFYYLDGWAFLWSSTECYSYFARYRDMNCSVETVGHLYISKVGGFSVRCLKD